MQDKYLSCAEVAQIAQVKIKTVWNWCKSGKLKASRPGGRVYWIKESDFEEFLGMDNRKQKSKV